MIRGVLIGFATYALFSFGDAALKAAGGRLSVFQIIFVSTLFSSLVALFAKPRGERWTDAVRMQQPWLVWLRVAMSICTGLFGAVAFTTLPLAETYSLLFLMPIFVAGLAALLLGERMGWARIAAVFVGLAGVLLVVRPGFRELQIGHIAGVANALCSSIALLVLRKVVRTERQVTLIGTMMIGTLVFTGVMSLFVYVPMTAREWLLLAVCGSFAGLAQLTMLAATRYAPANRVGPTQYSQIVWAVILGALFFGEYPDLTAVCGMVLVCGSGLFAFLRDDAPAEKAPG